MKLDEFHKNQASKIEQEKYWTHVLELDLFSLHCALWLLSFLEV